MVETLITAAEQVEAVLPAFMRVIFASGSCGCIQSSLDPFFGRLRSKRASSARVGVDMPEASASPRRNVS